MRRVLFLGLSIALQDLLVGLSFLVIQAVVNTLGVTASAGAGKMDRARKALRSTIIVSTCFGIVMFVLAFFKGTLLTGIFAKDLDVISFTREKGKCKNLYQRSQKCLPM